MPSWGGGVDGKGLGIYSDSRDPRSRGRLTIGFSPVGGEVTPVSSVRLGSFPNLKSAAGSTGIELPVVKEGSTVDDGGDE